MAHVTLNLPGKVYEKGPTQLPPHFHTPMFLEALPPLLVAET